MKKLKDKVALITGAASGMGRAMALLFASEGARVMATDMNAHALNKVVAEIKAKGGLATSLIINVSKEADIKKMINETISNLGTLDILVNNAGVMDDFMPVDQVSNDLWNKVMGINVNGPFYACRLAIPIMLQKGSGVIINIASVGGLFGSRAGAAYSASKHAIIGLTKNIGFMYAQKGIRCNAIAPGGVNTNIGADMKPNTFGYERCTSGGASVPRMGEAEEIANTALFLACNDSSFINGAVITADGGWTAY